MICGHTWIYRIQKKRLVSAVKVAKLIEGAEGPVVFRDLTAPERCKLVPIVDLMNETIQL